MDNKENGKKTPDNDSKKPKRILLTLLITIGLVVAIITAYNLIRNSQYEETTFNKFRQELDAGNIAEAELQFDRIVFLTKDMAAKPEKEQQAYYTGLPSNGDALALAEEMTAKDVTVKQIIVEDNSMFLSILYFVGMFVLFFLLINMFTKRMGSGMMGGIGSSRAKMYMEKKTGVTFQDVAGQDEAKESLQEIIDFLHNPQKYTEIGAKLP